MHGGFRRSENTQHYPMLRRNRLYTAVTRG